MKYILLLALFLTAGFASAQKINTINSAWSGLKFYQNDVRLPNRMVKK